MTRIKRFNFEKFSILDVKEYLEKCGLKTDIKILRGGTKALWVKGQDVGIDFPIIDAGGGILTAIRFENYPRTENFEESRRIYDKLKRKFAVKSEEKPQKNRLGEKEKPTNIKDNDKIEIIDFRK